LNHSFLKADFELPLVCPCCHQVRTVDETDLLEKERSAIGLNLEAGWSIKAAGDGTLQWACRHCIETSKAIEGRPLEQTFCDCPAYLAYYDVTLKCEDCREAFTFSAAEQQFWYETLKFWVQSRPKQCAPCRKARRARRRSKREE
jgi:hypothetical protein